MDADVRQAFLAALSGPSGRIVRIDHPWLRTYAANFQGHPALIFFAPVDKSRHTPADGKGYAVTTALEGGEGQLRITSRMEGLTLVFEKLVEFVLERTSAPDEPGRAADLVVAALEEFRAFTQRKPGRLGEASIRGLFSELKFLLDLQATRALSPLELFGAWGGPFGSLHDITLPNGEEFEIKSTHRPPTSVRITSTAQVRPTGGSLRLAVLPIERVNSGAEGGTRVLDLVSELSEMATSAGGDVLDTWDCAIGAIGLDVDDPYYEQWAFTADEWLGFDVREGFPHIADEAIPEAVLDVTYSLDLAAISEYRVENPFDEEAK